MWVDAAGNIVNPRAATAHLVAGLAIAQHGQKSTMDTLEIHGMEVCFGGLVSLVAAPEAQNELTEASLLRHLRLERQAPRSRPFINILGALAA